MDALTFDGMNSLPDGFLESIAGGVLSDHNRDEVRQYAQGAKDQGYPLIHVLSWWRTLSDGFVDPADEQECEDIIRSVFES